MTLAALEGRGAEVSPNDPPEARHAFVGFGEQDRAGGLEFDFADASLQRFYARCFEAASCDFEFWWPGRPRFRLPVSEADVSTVLVDVASTGDHSGH